MRHFTITNHNNVTAHASAKEAHALGDGVLIFTSHAELGKTTAECSMSRLAETWNSFAGVVPFDDLKPVKKFTDRRRAVRRIWAAIQRLAASRAAPAGAKGRIKAEAVKRATKSGAVRTVRDGSKKAKVLTLLERQDGVTLTELMKATGWQAHTVRGFLSGALGKKMSLKIDSVKRADGGRTYRLAK